MYYLYTDGATSNNGAPNANGGWAWALYDNDYNILAENSGHLNNTTNNICEMTALLKGCYCSQAFLTNDDILIIKSDSAYIINCYKQKWYKNWQINGWITSSKTPVKNKDLWEKIVPFFEKTNFSFEKVKGHDMDQYNNYVDQKAVEAKNVSSRNTSI